MRRIFSIAGLFILSCVSCCAQEADTPAAWVVNDKQSELCTAYENAAAAFAQFPTSAVVVSESWVKRKREMQTLSTWQSNPEITRLTSQPGASLMWRPRQRMAPLPVVSAKAYAVGPNGAVVPFSGEFTDGTDDLAGLGRGGIGFILRRQYASFARYDCGFGIGWSFNYNAGIVVEGGDFQKAKRLTLFVGARDIRFTRKGNEWSPEPGSFLHLECGDNRIFISTPDLLRYEFEQAAEQVGGCQRWRVARIAARQDHYRANHLTFAYLPGCDRVQSVTDAFGEKFTFAYDGAGHIRQVAGNRRSVEYAYDDSGRLTLVRYAPVNLSLAETGFRSEVRYQYATGADALLVGKTSNSLMCRLVVEYDAQQRVRSAGFVAPDRQQMWMIDYLTNNVTVVQAPMPSPAIRYTFTGTPHPSLPSAFEIPAQQARWQYAFNPDYLATTTVDPLDVRTVRTYDSANADVRAHGNCVKEEQFAAPTGIPCGLKSRGKRTQYHAQIALPTKVEYFQCASDGQERILKTESMTYSDGDLLLLCHETGGVKSYKAYNRFGLPALAWDDTGTVTVSYYGEAFPKDFSFDFVQGDVRNGGPLVREVQDAKPEDIAAACQALGHAEVASHVGRRLPACALETRYAYDPDGNTIHSKSGRNETLSIFSANGKCLVSCDAATGITEYRYCKSGRTERIYHEFCPGENVHYDGHPFLHFSNSSYSAEVFKYDSLDMLAEHQLTDESFQNVVPVFRYERYPNGKVKRIVNPMKVARVDEYDPQTGRLQKQTLVGESACQGLTSNYCYYANGQVKSYVDQNGGRHLMELDSFGRVVASTDAQGVKTVREFDALDREIAQMVVADGKLLKRHESVYSVQNQQIEMEKTYQIEGDQKDVLVSARYLYDAVGNLIGKRGVREDSWTYFLVDGLGATVATMAPGGDISVKVLRDGEPVYTSTILRGENGERKSQGAVIEYDFAGRAVKTTPVDTYGHLVPTRGQTVTYNALGQKIQTDSQQLVTTVATYNSLGKVVREEVRPNTTKFGEKPQVTEYEYRADGQTIRKKIGNQALALRGEKSDVCPELVDAPQISEWMYDELGRVRQTVQPDGLIISKTYNASSLPVEMKWAHVAEPDKVLRSLSLAYTVRGEVSSIRNGLSGDLLREYAYDKLGNCVAAVDHGTGRPVYLERQFDSLGNQVMEKVEYDGLPLPCSSFAHDYRKGTVSAEWKSFTPPNDRYWRRETRQYDRASRLTGLALDGQASPFAEWRYVGNLCTRRDVPESQITARTVYTTLLEPKETILCDAYSNPIGRLAYEYGAQGQPIFAATELGSDYTFSVYSQFDSFRRVVGQNGEAVKPDGEARERHRKIFDDKSQAVAAVNTSWMVYDQANNIWGRYRGQQIETPVPDALCDLKRMPRFSSPASVIAGTPATDIPELAQRELASNRETATACYAGDCNLEATEQIYDRLGNLVEYKGTFWNGTRRYPVKWKLTFDPLGRLGKMCATTLESMGIVTNGAAVAELTFVYDAENRRLMKRVADLTRLGGAVTKTEMTLYRGNQQALIYELGDDRRLELVGEYLWGASQRELLMAALPEQRAEKQGDFKVSRYFFQQDKGLNVVFTSKAENGLPVTVAAESYLGFGDNSTVARIRDVESSFSGVNKEHSFNCRLDEGLDASWGNPGKNQYMLLYLSEESKLANLTIWASRFSRDFFVFVLPQGVRAPHRWNLSAWLNERRNWETYFAARVANGQFGDQVMGESLTSPYRLPLRELRGDRVLLVFDDRERTDLNVREFEVCKVADNPSPIAFAGQWLDRETGMYYQVNRYRLAGSDKFISPDPIGFLSGSNLYAYANGNPLEWHDPDGRFPLHVLIGAGIGAVIGGGMYAINCWMNGDDFDFVEFGISILAGAASGAVAAALLPVNPILAGAAAGAVGGFISEGGISLYRTGDWEQSLMSGVKGAAWGAAAGAFAGSLGMLGGSSQGWSQLLRSVGSAGTTGALFGGARSAVDAYVGTGNLDAALMAGQQGVFRGGIMGGIAGAGGFLVSKAAQHFENAHTSYARPGYFRRGVVAKAFENAKDAHGRVRDPKTQRYMSKNGPFDMGHKARYEYRKARADAERRMGLTRADFLDSQNDPNHYRPELPSSNRSHAMEDHTPNFKGAGEFAQPYYDDFSQLISSSLGVW